MTPSRTPARRAPLLALAGLGAALAAAGVWYLFLRPAGPPPVSLASLPAVAAAPTLVAASPAGPSAGLTTDPAPGSGGPVSSGGFDGTWTIDPSVGSFADFSGSFVGYRVREQLATIGAAEAIGRTPDVTGTLVLDGTTITSVEVTADLTTLRSDEANRDRQLGRQALETSRFPTATFSLAKPIELGSIPEEGVTIDVTAAGELTVHGQTRAVEVPLQARLQGGVVSVAASLPITFADYGIAKPQAMLVLSVADHGTMEVQLHFTRALG